MAVIALRPVEDACLDLTLVSGEREPRQEDARTSGHGPRHLGYAARAFAAASRSRRWRSVYICLV
jgi:hypothetical protein